MFISEVSKNGWRTEGVGARKSPPHHKFKPFYYPFFLCPLRSRRAQFWGTFFAVFGALLGANPLPPTPFSKTSDHSRFKISIPEGDLELLQSFGPLLANSDLPLEGPTRKPRHASVFSTSTPTRKQFPHSTVETNVYRHFFSTRARVLKTHRHAVYHCLKEVQKPFSTR